MSTEKMHPLLLRQLKSLGLDDTASNQAGLAPAAWHALRETVSRAYREFDTERYLLEHSQTLASEEIESANRRLREERDSLERRVSDRTAALALSEGRLCSLLNLSSDWVWEQDETGRYTFISEGLRHRTGLEPDSAVGKTWREVGAFETSPETAGLYDKLIGERESFRQLCFTFMPADGRPPLRVSISGEPVFDSQGAFRGYRGVGSNITQTWVAEQQLLRLARFDSLTGLANRNLFQTELGQALALAQGGLSNKSLAVCFIDLNRFKPINDSLGHGAGDDVLQTVAQRLRSQLRQTDVVGRLGGDEFVVMLDACDDLEALANIARKLLEAIAQPMVVQGQALSVTASIGISRYPMDGQDVATLLRCADSAMYAAKNQGDGGFEIYHDQYAKPGPASFALENDLRLALQRDELALHYQPKFALDDGRLHGLEALVRWTHPVHGPLSPGQFIPLAEVCGLIVPLGRWIMTRACRQIRDWRESGLQVPRCAVNLSARQLLHPDLVSEVLATLDAHGLEPGALEFEVTESMLMVDPVRAIDTLNKLSALGIHLSIDDFGTGYSSLSYLKQFPAKTVKIDRSFINGLPRDADDRAITQAVIAMAHSLGMDVVAEGVETPDQHQTLVDMGCDTVQGYLTGRPVPASDFETWLR